MISKEKAAELLMKMNAVDEAKKKGADGKACWTDIVTMAQKTAKINVLKSVKMYKMLWII